MLLINCYVCHHSRQATPPQPFGQQGKRAKHLAFKVPPFWEEILSGVKSTAYQ